jgi:hypothetical protein
MKQKNKTNYLQLIANYQSLVFLGLGILVFLIGIFIVWPKIQDVNNARNTLNTNTQYLNKLKAKLKDLQSLNEFELTDRHNLSIRAIPEVKNPLGTLISLRSLATDLGVDIEEISVTVGGVSSESAEIKDTGLAKINFKVKLSGSKTTVFDFFKKTEESLPIVTADNVKVSLSGESASAELNLNSYYLSYPETIGKIDQPVSKLSNEEEKLLSKISSFSYIPATTFTPAQGRSDPFTF